MTVTASMIMINVAVFMMWIFGVPSQAFMIENFLTSWNALAEGRIWVLLTSVFSHNMLWHLLINMLVLANFGEVIERTLGSRRFLTFYLTAGMIASLSHSMVSAFLLDEPGIPALGASGAVSGVILVFALVFPQAKILLLGLIPVRAIWGALIFIGLDFWGLVAQTRGGGLPIGHGAHLGGAFTGIVYYFLRIRGRGTNVTSQFGRLRRP